MRMASCLIWIIVMGHPCWARDYFVAPLPLGSDAGYGAATQPFATIQQAMDTANPGDTVWVQDGFYRESVSISKSGRPQAPITLRAVHAGGVVVDGSAAHGGWEVFQDDIMKTDVLSEPGGVVVEGVPMRRVADTNRMSPGSYCLKDGEIYLRLPKGFVFSPSAIGILKREEDKVVDLWAVRDIRIEGLVIQHGTGAGLSVGADRPEKAGHVVVKNCTFRWNWRFGAYVYKGHDCLFEENTSCQNVLENWKRTDDNGGWAAGMACYRSRAIHFKANRAFDNHGEGIVATRSSDVDFSGNRVCDNYSVNLYVDNSRDVRIDSNFIFASSRENASGELTRNTPVGIGAADEDYGYGAQLSALTITNNIVSGCSSGIAYWKEMETSMIRDWLIAHNTLAGNRMYGISITVDHEQENQGNRIYNNIVAQQEGWVFRITGGNHMDIDHNLFWHENNAADAFIWNDRPHSLEQWQAASRQGANCLLARPDFEIGKGSAAKGYQLRKSSAAIDHARPLDNVRHDYLGTARPQYGGFDIGAFEFME